MEHNHSDEIIRARLEHAAVPPPPFVWEGIERTLHQNRRKPFPWLWLTGFLLTGALAGGAWLWFASSENPHHPAASPDAQTVPATESVLPPSEPLPYAQISSGLSPDNTLKTTSHTATSQAANDNIGLKTSKNTQKTQYLSGSALPSNTLITEGSSAAPYTSSQPITPASTGISSAAPTTTANTLPTGPNISVGALIKSAPLTNLALLPTHIAQPAKSRTPQARVDLQVLPHRTRVHRYNLDERRSAWFIDAYTGPLMAQKVLTNNAPSPEADTYRQLRLDTEGTGWGFNAGMRATRLFGGNWLISTGLDYRQFTEKFSFDQEVQLQYTIENNGTDTIAAVFGRRSLVRYNRFGCINLPLSVGYEFRKRRVGLQIHLGAAANVFFWKNGSILDPDTFHPTAFGTGNLEVFRASAGFQAKASTQVFWQFRRDMRIFVEPFCESSLNAITLSNFPTSQRYQIYGLKWGFAKIF